MTDICVNIGYKSDGIMLKSELSEWLMRKTISKFQRR